MAEFPLSGVGAEPAAAPVGEVIDRRKQPRLPAELLCVLFRIAVFVQQGDTAPTQPEQPLLLIPGDADVLYRVRREAFLVPQNRFQFAVPLDGASPTDGKRAEQALFRPTGDPPGEQPHIGLRSTEDADLYAHALQCGDGRAIDEVPVLRHLAGDMAVKHHFAVHRLIQRFPVTERQQDGGDAVLSKGTGCYMFQPPSSPHSSSAHNSANFPACPVSSHGRLALVKWP